MVIFVAFEKHRLMFLEEKWNKMSSDAKLGRSCDDSSTNTLKSTQTTPCSVP